MYSKSNAICWLMGRGLGETFFGRESLIFCTHKRAQSRYFRLRLLQGMQWAIYMQRCGSAPHVQDVCEGADLKR